ncbi:D-alanine--D-alanine ligase family protein [Glycomyces sp. TRM65418]|uniref:D-alanine--D-alanine ligase family protein n=1 Tax=Glycomyces sp. TRM65418 TaxID=2867006 RepID=UPI001CE50036|nr:D-alanine--D-alanine ligase family protein [Glycomyces sp. TRM65418]QZD57979.1 D-alanine--D-alanine ligase [Glycomyces sp. TRM65418]
MEQPVSCASGSGVAKALRERGFDVTTIGITRTGEWVQLDPDATFAIESSDALPEITAETGKAVAVDLGPGAQPMADVLFPVLHGPYGEDGTIQGLFEMAGVPYVGSGVLSSSLCMDKEFSKRLLAAEGVPQGPFAVLKPGEDLDAQAVVDRLGLPVFVKPARAGSSLGISKVGSGAELAAAVAKAREVDDKVVFEASFENVREIEMGVLETLDGDLEVTFPLEVLAKGEDGWFDFEAKYLDNPEPFNLRPDYPEGVAEQAQALARKVFRLLDCRDLARVDCFLTEDGTVYLNEVNTMPGMTPMSGVPQAFDAYGISYGELVERLVTLAAARARRS